MTRDPSAMSSCAKALSTVSGRAGSDGEREAAVGAFVEEPVARADDDVVTARRPWRGTARRRRPASAAGSPNRRCAGRRRTTAAAATNRCDRGAIQRPSASYSSVCSAIAERRLHRRTGPPMARCHRPRSVASVARPVTIAAFASARPVEANAVGLAVPVVVGRRVRRRAATRRARPTATTAGTRGRRASRRSGRRRACRRTSRRRAVTAAPGVSAADLVTMLITPLTAFAPQVAPPVRAAPRCARSDRAGCRSTPRRRRS